jgi:hypothetical protein
MKFKILNKEITIYTPFSKEALRQEKVREYKLNATRALIAAEMTLSLQERLQELQEEHGRTEAEKKGIADAIEFEKKSVLNWKTQLDVINNW